MKKFIIILAVAVLSLVSCRREYNYETTITYRVYYPGNPVVKTYHEDTTDDPVYYLSSDRGTNYLYFDGTHSFFSSYGTRLESTSAPIEVISFVKVKKRQP